ncbi:MAG: pilus assembly protein PilM [Shewanella oncorhynchi]
MAIHLTVAMRVIAIGMTSVIAHVTARIMTRRTVCIPLFIMALAFFSAFSSFAVFAADTATNNLASNSDVSKSSAQVSKTITTAIQQEWLLKLLDEALRRSDSGYQVQEMSTQMNQKRKVEEALAGTVDVFWSMTSKELEETVLPVRIPLFKGLLGNRLLIIRKSDEARFANVKTMADFRQLKAGQNRYWPDATILEANGLPVVTSYQYTNLYPMLEGGRFDYLALGAQEIGEELANRPDPALKVDSHILLQSEEIKLVLTKVTDLVSNISNMNIEVSHAAQEQTCVTEAISRTLNDLANVSGSASLDSEHLAHSSERLFHQGERLRTLVTSFRL